MLDRLIGRDPPPRTGVDMCSHRRAVGRSRGVPVCRHRHRDICDACNDRTWPSAVSMGVIECDGRRREECWRRVRPEANIVGCCVMLGGLWLWYDDGGGDGLLGWGCDGMGRRWISGGFVMRTPRTSCQELDDVNPEIEMNEG